jgi:hypothetical protein
MTATVRRLLALAAVVLTGCGRLGFSGSIASSTLALDRHDPRETLADFPLLVVLDDTRADRSLLAADASDLRFLDDSGNVLAHEIEQVGAAGGDPLIAWVRVPTIAGTTTRIVARYGESPPAASSQSVWSASYAVVFHFTPDLRDATTNQHDGVALGAQPAPGMIAGGYAFAAAMQDAVRIVPAADLAFDTFTLSGWMNEATLPPFNLFHALATLEVGTGGGNVFWLGDFTGMYNANVSTTAMPQLALTARPASTGNWAHLALVADATTASLFVDGVQYDQIATGAPLVQDADPIYLGADSNGGTRADSDWLDGTIDELRLEHGVRSAAWLATDDLAMRDRLITYGPIEYR